MYDSEKSWGSGLSLIAFYRSQLLKFNNLGFGKQTEFNVVVTENLISATKRRLAELINKRAKRAKSKMYVPKALQNGVATDE